MQRLEGLRIVPQGCNLEVAPLAVRNPIEKTLGSISYRGEFPIGVI